MTEFKVGDRVRGRHGEGTVRAVDTFSDGVPGCAVKFDSGEFATISSSDSRHVAGAGKIVAGRWYDDGPFVEAE